VSLKLITASLTAAILGAAAPAVADTTDSSNWAGYAVHRSGTSFTRVMGTWRQPRSRCSAGRRTYSSLWVGLGGYSVTSGALEQIGTEADCTSSGKVSSTAWYELVPDASRSIQMTVQPGDLITATVLVNGARVQLGLSDLSTKQTFLKTLTASAIDVSSAEWIVEAPSECYGITNCRILPLADFGSATFRQASAQAASGHVGSISDVGWDTTRIRLAPGGRRFVLDSRTGTTAGVASPSSLRAGGSAFDVKYSVVTVARAALAATARAVSVSAGHLYH
jgi:Peptidase A4 family